MLTEHQRAVLAHVVVSPEAWLAHVEAQFGVDQARAMLEAKVARWSDDFAAESAKPDYKTRAQRDAETPL